MRRDPDRGVCWTPTDFIAIVALLLGCLLLIVAPSETAVLIVITIIAFYFGHAKGRLT